jgi:hypothetical protein
VKPDTPGLKMPPHSGLRGYHRAPSVNLISALTPYPEVHTSGLTMPPHSGLWPRQFTTVPGVDPSFDIASVRGLGHSQPQLLTLAIKCAGIDSQNAGGVFAAGIALEQEPDVFGLELLEADGRAHFDRAGLSAARSSP